MNRAGQQPDGMAPDSGAIPKYHLEGLFDPASAHPDDAHSIQARLIPAGSRVLELGCASGYMSGYLEQSRACTVIGLDFDPLAVSIASTRTTAAFVADLETESALECARPYAPFDVLYAANVLEHIRSAEQVLLNAHALLSPQALVVIALPNIAHYSVRWRLLRGQFNYTDYGIMDRTHVHFYTVKTAVALLEQCGYRVETLSIAGSFLQNALNALARRQKRPLPRLMLPGLLAYEIILTAHRA